VLVETAIVGHLGTPQLAALAIAATRLSTGLTLFNLLTYGTTAQVARLHGTGELFTVALLLAPPAVALIEGAVR
jgi:Na+-driven multidrug efflux pump